jgi:hypothetical protein
MRNAVNLPERDKNRDRLIEPPVVFTGGRYFSLFIIVTESLFDS